MSMNVRQIAAFLLTAVILQTLGMLLLTPEAVACYFAAAVLTAHDTIVCGDNSHTDYYSLHDRIAKADVIILGIDRTKKESYTLAADFLTSLRYEKTVSTVLITGITQEAGDYWEQYSDTFLTDDEEMEYYKERLNQSNDPESYFGFYEVLAEQNKTLPPQKRFTIKGGRANESSYDYSVTALIDSMPAEAGKLVFVLTDYQDLSDPYSPLRTDTEQYLALQCRYHEPPAIPFLDFGTPLWLVNTQKMTFFNNWYEITDHSMAYKKQTPSFTQNYSTEPFFLFFTSSVDDSSEGEG